MLAKKRQLALTLLKYKVPNEGVIARLPEAYHKYRKELFETLPKPVHYIPEPGKWKRDPKTGVVTPVQNVPIPTIMPKELNDTLLGGEMVIRGFQKRNPTRRRVPHFWTPHFKRSVVYSEILNKHLSVIVTERLVLLLHEHKGFDNYLLQNQACDLRTNLALKIKRAILMALSDKNLPYDKEKNKEIYEKYKQYLIPREEIEWYGLSLSEACRKQEEIEENAYREKLQPLKHLFRQQLIEELRAEANNLDTQENLEKKTTSTWLSKIKNPFSTKRN